MGTTLLTILLALSLPAKAAALDPIKVMIDPGHGGEDDGAKLNGVKEKTIALHVGLDLKELFSKNPNFLPILTRDKDIFIPLDDRSAMARGQNAEIFISIHANSSPSRNSKGAEFYFENQVATDEESMRLANRENNIVDGKYDKTAAKDGDIQNILRDLAHNDHILMSQHLAQNLLNSFKTDFHFRPRAIRQAPFRVLSVSMAATLIELGFVSNPSEAAWMNERENQKKMANAIYKGVLIFKEKLDKIRRPM